METRRVIKESEDSSDEIHDRSRDGKSKEIPTEFNRLTGAWAEFWKRMNAKLPGLDE